MKGFENSYIALRKTIGLLGIALPVILLLGSIIFNRYVPFQSSISCYYHTGMRNIFEGIIWIFAIILVFYNYKGKDSVITTIAGICALGVALCPTHVADCATCKIPSHINNITGDFHNGFAAAFFILLAFISLYVFTKTHKDRKPTPEKLKRNRIYKTCGIIMLVCILSIAVYWFLLEHKYQWLDDIRPVFWLESFALWAFGFSWIVKGEMVLTDKPQING